MRMLDQKAVRALKTAKLEATALGAAYVSTPHLLLGLMQSELDSGALALSAALYKRDVRSACQTQGRQEPESETGRLLEVDFAVSHDVLNIIRAAHRSARRFERSLANDVDVLSCMLDIRCTALEIMWQLGADRFEFKRIIHKGEREQPVNSITDALKAEFPLSARGKPPLRPSRRCLKAIALAIAHARRTRRERFHLEHLLVGLAGTPGGLAAALLGKYEITCGALEARIEQLHPILKGPPSPPEILPSRDVDLCFFRAIQLARRSRSTLIETEHLLLSLLDAAGIIEEIFRAFDLDYEDLIMELEAAMGIGMGIQE